MTIYHGTPLTPRAALLDVCMGRAMCVSFFRPDDVEVVEAISPAVMFRQRGFFLLAAGDEARRGLARDCRLDTLLRLVGASPVHARTMGNHAGYSWCAVPAQRQPARRMALRSEGRARLAHGWADRAASQAVRAMGPRVPWMDRAEGRITRLPRANGRGRARLGQSLASAAHAAGNSRGLRLPLSQRRQHEPCAERMAL